MADLIEREPLLEKMFPCFEKKLVREAPAVNRWIPVEDALPKSNGCYLVWRPRFYIDGDRECGEATVCYFDGHDTWHDSYGVDFSRVLDKDDITHWMPLPEPPESEGMNEKINVY